MAPNAKHTSIIGSSESVFESSPTTITEAIKITQPPLTTRTRTRKSVSWAPSALAYNITHIKDMSEEYIKTVWYEPKDYKAFKKDCRESAILAIRLLLDSGSPMRNASLCCVRGVEHHADKQVGSLRRLRRKSLWYIVLEEQRDQLTMGVCDPDAYEELCYEISASALRHAHMKAMQDYEEVLLQQEAKDGRKQAAALSKQRTSSKICALTA